MLRSPSKSLGETSLIDLIMGAHYKVRVTVFNSTLTQFNTRYGQNTACRHDRLPVHGQGAFQRLAPGAAFFSTEGRGRIAHHLRTRPEGGRSGAATAWLAA